MDYERKYPLTQIPGEYLLVSWIRGYKEVELRYRDRLITEVKGIAPLHNGVTFKDEQLGRIELKLSEKPVVLDLIVDGYHSPVNVSHPAKQLKSASTYFWMIAALAIIGSLLEGVNIGFGSGIGLIISSLNFLTVALYIISAVFVSRSQPWAYWLGFCVFCFWTLIALMLVPLGGFLDVIIMLIRLVFLYFLITNIKHAAGTAKHRRFGSKFDEKLLDSMV